MNPIKIKIPERILQEIENELDNEYNNYSNSLLIEIKTFNSIIEILSAYINNYRFNNPISTIILKNFIESLKKRNEQTKFIIKDRKKVYEKNGHNRL
jgi:hypothetical protein